MTILALSTSGAVELTAYATLALAVVTGVLAYATFRSVNVAKTALAQTRTAIEVSQAHLKQTQEEIGLSRQEVEQAQRPVVVPVIEQQQMELPGYGLLQRCPQFAGNRVFIPVSNIGSGPALDVNAIVSMLSEDGAQFGGTGRTMRVAGIGAGASAILEFRIGGLPSLMNFTIEIAYGDVATKRWQTSAIFVLGAGEYDAMQIRPAELQPEVVGL